MAQNGINTTVEETKKELAQIINDKLQLLPISIINLIMDNIAYELRTVMNDTLIKEKQQTEEQEQAEEQTNDQQVEWNDAEAVDVSEE